MDTKSRSDYRKLIKILDSIENLISDLVEDDGDFVLHEFARDQGYRGLLWNAWRKVRHRLHEIRERIGKLEREVDGGVGHFNELPEDRLERDLAEAGLLGEELEYKYELITRLFDRFNRRRTSLWLRRLLGAINSFLGSLGQAVPGSEAVREIKEMIEQTLKVDRRKPKPDYK